jgi:WLM domain
MVLCCLIIALFIIVLYMAIKYYVIDNVAPFTSVYNGKNYEVRKIGDNINKQTAANYLALLNEKVDKVVDYMHKYSLPDRETSRRLYHRWLKCELKETNSHDTSAAFTLNKSKEIRICIRNKDGDFEDPNTSMFVLLHELAHVASITYGHDEEFKNNFTYITHLASGLGLYKPEDFHNNPKTYCGVNINTTPCNETTCKYNALKK